MTDLDDERSVTIEHLEVRAKELQSEAEAAKSVEDVDKTKTRIEELRQLLREGVEWWAQFDVRRGQQLVEQTEREIDAAQRRVKPRRRFKFKSATTSKPSSKTTTTTPSTAVPKKLDTPHENAENEDDSNNIIQIKLSGIDHGHSELETVSVGRGTIEGRGVQISEGQGRHIFIEEGARSLWLVSLNKCTVDISDVDGPVWILDCKHCIIRCRCRQLRVHRCHCCLLRTCVVGAPVLENCSEMRVGPLKTGTLDGNLTQEREEGRWKDVVDMSWLREGESTNWRFVTESEDDEAVFRSAEDAPIL